MGNFSGTIFSGTFDQVEEIFYLTQVKNLQTQSRLSEHQLNQLYYYLDKQENSCMVTVNDQIPILLQKEEINQLLLDIDDIMRDLGNRNY